jgi:hypothetical protein
MSFSSGLRVRPRTTEYRPLSSASRSGEFSETIERGSGKKQAGLASRDTRPEGHYSLRNAVMGSTRVARLAGT